MATDALGPSNAPDDDGLETPDKILYSDFSTGAPSSLHSMTLTRCHQLVASMWWIPETPWIATACPSSDD